MQENINKIIKQKLGKHANIEKQIPTSNNFVYVIENNGKEYMFKIYHGKNWPEDGKLPYINKILKNLKVDYAKEIAYNRKSAMLGGYVIEERLKGVPALDSTLTNEDLKTIYEKLAEQIKIVHSVKFEKYAFLNFGNPQYDTFGEYLEEYMSSRVAHLQNIGFIFANNSKKIIENVCKNIDEFKLKSCLCHGDLSIRNVLFDNGKINIIDWDDAMAMPAYADIARMTYDMMWLHNNFEEYKKYFLNKYFCKDEIKKYLKFEKIYHIFCSVEFIDFSLSRNIDDRFLNKKIIYLKKLINDLNF